MISGVWWSTLFPALAIASTVVAINFIADSLQSVPLRMTVGSGSPRPRRPSPGRRRTPRSGSRTCRSHTWSGASGGRSCAA